MEVFCTNPASESLYRSSGFFYGLVHEKAKPNKYLPKGLKELLEFPALPLSHRSLLF